MPRSGRIPYKIKRVTWNIHTELTKWRKPLVHYPKPNLSSIQI